MIHTSDHLDALTEVVNIGVGRAAAALSELLGSRIDLTVPTVSLLKFSELSEEVSSKLDTSIIQDFVGPTSGRAILAFPDASALKLGQILADLDDIPPELDFDLQDVLNEVGNIVLNGVLGSLSNIVKGSLQYTVPVLATETSLIPTCRATSWLRLGGPAGPGRRRAV